MEKCDEHRTHEHETQIHDEIPRRDDQDLYEDIPTGTDEHLAKRDHLLLG